MSRVITFKGITGVQASRLAEWTGRLLLLGAVAFWWGAIVVPQLFSLSFPLLLPWSALPPQLNPDAEGSVANTVSAVCLFAVAILALANALRSSRRFSTRRASNRTAIWGWTLLAAMTALVAWEEKTDFRGWLLPALGKAVFGDLWAHTSGIDGTTLLSPLILAFVVAMSLFIRKGLSSRAVRVLLIMGLTAWLLSIVYDKGGLRLATSEWYILSVLLEETLEFSGTLLIGLGAGIALGGGAVSRPQSGTFRRRQSFLSQVGAVTAVVVLGGSLMLVAVSSYREPLLDTRGSAVFNVNLYDHPVEDHSLIQELGAFSTPLARLRLRVANADPHGRSGVMLWRVMEAGQYSSGRILREGRVKVAAEDEPRWEIIDFPPLAEALDLSKGRPIALQLVAEVEPESYLRIGGTKTQDFEHLQFLINSEETWPNQKLELVAYGPSNVTRGQLQAIWRHFEWSWSVLAGAALIGLSIITFVPALLVTAALPRRGLPKRSRDNQP
ncbi:MAG: hypothetical protein OXG11_12950 [Chloroflexi bacterium]|nr:hypothetical protein [Chloroflexota bacterium]